MILQANAKINIGLRIIGKRADGYHDLETCFHEIPWHDDLELQTSTHLTMISNSVEAPADDSNLCLRAARLLQKAAGVTTGASIALQKNIPVGAGLGGGSSDAAAVLRGLNLLWNLNLSSSELRSLGADLGADVAFFIDGGSAYATGRGEILEHCLFAIPYWMVVAVPPVHVSTAWAYGNLKQKSGYAARKLKTIVTEQLHDRKIFSADVVNDFEPSVFEAYPLIQQTKRTLILSGATFALMSGSGSSVFGFFENELSSRRAAASFDTTVRIFIAPPQELP
ncbi:MAG TPA: 4-(cytidine 5'-diphospho)-2-C-methyl-D-erythritol kinase [Bacteroidota bacterium]|nr:4-(cytidine 5'-diphospho)-2-C-methyl-D-erythritol kinase [Bacteroidota bacterium]